MTLATIAELEARLGVDEGSLVGAELARAQAALEDVSTDVLDIAGKSWVEVDVPGGVRRVVLAAAKRIVENPQGLASEQAGEYGWRRSTSQTGDLLLPAERARVLQAAGMSGAYSVRTPLPDDHIINLQSVTGANGVL